MNGVPNAGSRCTRIIATSMALSCAAPLEGAPEAWVESPCQSIEFSEGPLEGMSFAIPANVLKGFLENRDAFAFDPRNPNTGFRYNPPTGTSEPSGKGEPR